MPRGGPRPNSGVPVGYRQKKTLVREAAAKKKLDELGLTAERVLQEMALLSFVNVQDLFDEFGNLKPIQDLTRDQAAAIASLEVIKKNAEAGDGKMDVIHKVKVWDKTKSLEMLGKYFALFKERVELTGLDALFERLTQGRHRNAQR